MTYLSTHKEQCEARFYRWLRGCDPLVINRRTVAIGRYDRHPRNYVEHSTMSYTQDDITIYYVLEHSNLSYGHDATYNRYCEMGCSYKGIKYGWRGPIELTDLGDIVIIFKRFIQLIMKFNGTYQVSC